MKYYKKMLTRFIIVSVVYTLLIQIVFLVGYYAFSKYNFDRNIEAFAVGAAEYTDIRLQSINQMYQLIRSNADVNKYSSEPVNTPNHYARLKTQEFIKKAYGTAAVEIQYLAVSKLSDNYAILHLSTGHLDFLAKQLGITRKDIDSVGPAFENDPNLPFLFIEAADGSGYVLVVCDKLTYSGRLYLFAKFARDSFISSTHTGDATIAIILNGKIVTTQGAFDRETIDVAMAGASGYNLTYVPSSVYNSGYLYITSTPQILLSRPTIVIFLLGLAAIGISIIIMLKVTKGVYDPIKQLVKSLGDTTRSDNEISFLQSKYRAMKEQMDSLNSSLFQYSDNLNKKLLRDLLIGIMSPDEAKNHFESLHFIADSGIYTSVLIKMLDVDNAEDSAYWDKLGAIKELLLPLLPKRSDMHSIIEVSADTLGMIFAGMNTDAVAGVMKNLISAIELDGFELCAAVGPPCDAIERIYDSYKIANRVMLQANSSLYRLRVLTPNSFDESGDSCRSLYYPLGIEQSIISGVINNRRNQWKSALTEIVDGNRGLSDFSHISLMLSTTVARITDNLNLQPSEFFGEDFVSYLEFRSCRNIDEISALADKMFNAMTDGINELRVLSHEDLGSKMKAFIRENYQKNISLHDLADYLNMTKNYVSTAFKSTIGIGFKEYISELRFNTACDIIIKNPDARLMDVAERVGCNSVSLARLFLRYYGGTPSDYQRQVLQGLDE